MAAAAAAAGAVAAAVAGAASAQPLAALVSALAVLRHRLQTLSRQRMQVQLFVLHGYGLHCDDLLFNPAALVEKGELLSAAGIVSSLKICARLPHASLDPAGGYVPPPRATRETAMGFAKSTESDSYAKQYEAPAAGVVPQADANLPAQPALTPLPPPPPGPPAAGQHQPAAPPQQQQQYPPAAQQQPAAQLQSAAQQQQQQPQQAAGQAAAAAPAAAPAAARGGIVQSMYASKYKSNFVTSGTTQGDLHAKATVVMPKVQSERALAPPPVPVAQQPMYLQRQQQGFAAPQSGANSASAQQVLAVCGPCRCCCI